MQTGSADVLKHVMVSTGTSDADFEKTQQILKLNPALTFICIDRWRMDARAFRPVRG